VIHASIAVALKTQARVGPRSRGGGGRQAEHVLRSHLATEDFMRTWIVHNIEDSGEEKFVPKLYRHAMEAGGAA
jgi:hypothetical protein